MKIYINIVWEWKRSQICIICGSSTLILLFKSSTLFGIGTAFSNNFRSRLNSVKSNIQLHGVPCFQEDWFQVCPSAPCYVHHPICVFPPLCPFPSFYVHTPHLAVYVPFTPLCPSHSHLSFLPPVFGFEIMELKMLVRAECVRTNVVRALADVVATIISIS